MNPDVSLMIGSAKFNFRVACVLEHNGKILLHKGLVDDFWNLVGGRIKAGEYSLDALKREMKEELNIEITNAKLINVSENFFNYDNKDYHELLFVYYSKLDKCEITNKQDFCSLDNDKIIYHWYTREEIKNIVCKPVTIYDLIYQNYNEISHNLIQDL